MSGDEFSLACVRFLSSPAATESLAALTPADLTDQALIPTLSRLRAAFSPAEAGALVTTARLRLRAAAKFPVAGRMFFTAEALEQATAYTVALYHADELDALAAPGPVLDLGCGIGGDTLALARHRRVIAYERDPVRAALAAANAAALNVADRIEVRVADWTEDLAAGTLPAAAAAFIDPARRIDGRRTFSLHAMEPNLDWLLRLTDAVPLVAAKVMPGVRDEEVPDGAAIDFIGHAGQCKEALLWFGRMPAGQRRACVQAGGQWHVRAASAGNPPLGKVAPGMILHEPHPALIRAGVFAEMCDELDAHLFDPQIAYLVADGYRASPLVQSFLIEERHPFTLKLLNRRLQALEIGRVELKKRGFPLAPESLRPRLKLAATDNEATVIFTRRGDERLMLIARRLDAMDPLQNGHRQ